MKDIVAHIQIINPLRRPLTLSTNSESASSSVFNSPLQLQLEFLHCPFPGYCKVLGYVINAVHKCVDGNLDLAWKMWRVLHWIEMELASRQEGVDLNQAVQTECLCHHHRKIAPWKLYGIIGSAKFCIFLPPSPLLGDDTSPKNKGIKKWIEWAPNVLVWYKHLIR